MMPSFLIRLHLRSRHYPRNLMVCCSLSSLFPCCYTTFRSTLYCNHSQPQQSFKTKRVNKITHQIWNYLLKPSLLIYCFILLASVKSQKQLPRNSHFWYLPALITKGKKEMGGRESMPSVFFHSVITYLILGSFRSHVLMLGFLVLIGVLMVSFG